MGRMGTRIFAVALVVLAAAALTLSAENDALAESDSVSGKLLGEGVAENAFLGNECPILDEVPDSCPDGFTGGEALEYEKNGIKFKSIRCQCKSCDCKYTGSDELTGGKEAETRHGGVMWLFSDIRACVESSSGPMGGLALGQSVSDEDAETCTDKQPPSTWATNTCAAHKAKGNCEQSWFRDNANGYCHKTCGKCTPDSTPKPDFSAASTTSGSDIMAIQKLTMAEFVKFGEHRKSDMRQARERCDKGTAELAESNTLATTAPEPIGFPTPAGHTVLIGGCPEFDWSNVWKSCAVEENGKCYMDRFRDIVNEISSRSEYKDKKIGGQKLGKLKFSNDDQMYGKDMSYSALRFCGKGQDQSKFKFDQAMYKHKVKVAHIQAPQWNWHQGMAIGANLCIAIKITQGCPGTGVPFVKSEVRTSYPDNGYVRDNNFHKIDLSGQIHPQNGKLYPTVHNPTPEYLLNEVKVTIDAILREAVDKFTTERVVNQQPGSCANPQCYAPASSEPSGGSSSGGSSHCEDNHKSCRNKKSKCTSRRRKLWKDRCPKTCGTC